MRDEDASTPAPAGLAPPAQPSGPPRPPAWVRPAIFALRLIRGVMYAVAVLQVLPLGQVVTLLIDGRGVSGAVMALVVATAIAFGALVLGVWLLRRAIDWLHVRYFGVAHPVLVCWRARASRRVYAKTGSGSRGELIRVLMGLQASARDARQ